MPMMPRCVQIRPTSSIRAYPPPAGIRTIDDPPFPAERRERLPSLVTCPGNTKLTKTQRSIIRLLGLDPRTYGLA